MKYREYLQTKLNDVWMNGFQEEEYGSCDEDGFSMALIITDDIIGIIKVDDQGFVDYDVYEDEKDARREWEGMVTWVELEKEREGV